jgi:hypothetical protein
LGATKRILVVRHPEDPFARWGYVIHLLMEVWRERGLHVELICDIDRTVEADVVIPHLDLTLTPRAYRDYFARYPVVLNRDVCDISKRRVSQNLVTRADGFDGAVIVKTDRNAGAAPELDALRHRGGVRRKMLQAARRLPWTLSGLLGTLEYKVYEHPHLVPRAVWHNPRLVVERFLPERRDDLYVLRRYVFLGSREYNTMAFSPVPIVKARNVLRREVLRETPEALRAMRERMGFDYGKFDYVMHDGQVILFDANRTPTHNARHAAGSSSVIAELARGIDDFFHGDR